MSYTNYLEDRIKMLNYQISNSIDEDEQVRYWHEREDLEEELRFAWADLEEELDEGW